MFQIYGEWGRHGLPYPVPALLAILPAALLPASVAIAVMLVGSLIGIAAVVFLHPSWWRQVLIPLLFLPVLRAAGLGQPSLLWVALAVLLVLALQRRWLMVAGFCLAVLPAKPQTGLVIAVVGGLYALRSDRAVLGWFLAWVMVLWGGAFVLVPNWVVVCLDSIIKYRSMYSSVLLLPFGLLIVLASFRLPWWAIASAAQVVLFPIQDLYGALPLVLAWAAIGGPIAWLGVGLSWGWALAAGLSFSWKLWLCILLPYGIAASWQSVSAYREDRALRLEPHGTQASNA